MRKLFFCTTAILFALIPFQRGYSQISKWPKTFLWRITGNGLSKPSYLYGTIHVSDRKLFYFGDSLYHYFEQAESFHIEVDADTLINASVRLFTGKNNGRLLKSLMARNEYDKYASKLSKTLGKPAQDITTKDVWYAKNQKTAEAAKKGDMRTFMDLYLYGLAKRQGKKVGGIEDAEDQLGIIDDLFDEADVAYLATDSLQNSGLNGVNQMKDLYLGQDLGGIDALTASGFNSKLKTLVLTNRNIKMARRMDSLANLRSSFFAVGVAHLPGDSGVINLLRKRGFSVEPVISSRQIAPEAYTYKTVSLPWLKYQQGLGLYQVEAPGALLPMDIAKEVMDMAYYYDLSSGKVYYTAVMNSVANVNQKDSVFAEVIRRMAANGRPLLSQKTIFKQNFEGREVVLKASDEQVMHMNIYLAGAYAYLNMVLSNKSEVNDGDSKRFFESFQMTPAAAIVRPYINYSDKTFAFSISMPNEPIVKEEKSTDGNGDLKIYTSVDYASGNTYVLSVRDTKPGFYTPNDSSYLHEIRESYLHSMTQDTLAEFTKHEGFPALRMSGMGATANIYYRTLTVLRGNRSYFLVIQTKNTQSGNALADSILQSFALNAYDKTEWTNQSAEDGSFSGWFPPAVVSEELKDTLAGETTPFTQNKKSDSRKEFLYYDKGTATSYNVERQTLPMYQFSPGDSSFFTTAAEKYKDKSDTITQFKLISQSKDKAADFIIERPGTSVVKRFRFILHGDTLYKVFTYTPRWLLKTEDTKNFFEQFAIKSVAPSTTVFTNKTKKLVDDLASADSTVFHDASSYLYDADLNKSDLHAFYPLLIKPLHDFSQSVYNTNQHLASVIAKIADSSTVDFVLQHFHDNQKLQYTLLKLLAEMNQAYASKAVSKLIDASIEPGGYATHFATALTDNLALAKIAFPRIISFTKDSAAVFAYAYLMKELIDSDYISRNDVLPFLDNFLRTAAGEKKKIQNKSSEYDYRLISVLEVIGVLNTPRGNATLRRVSQCR